MSASGPGTLLYTWKKDGEVITAERYPNCKGFDTDTLSISPFSSLYEGNYSCVITTQGGQSVESEVTKLIGREGMYECAIYIIYDCLILIKQGGLLFYYVLQSSDSP